MYFHFLLYDQKPSVGIPASEAMPCTVLTEPSVQNSDFLILIRFDIMWKCFYIKQKRKSRPTVDSFHSFIKGYQLNHSVCFMALKLYREVSTSIAI